MNHLLDRARAGLGLLTAVTLFGGLLALGAPASASVGSGANGLVAVASGGGSAAGPIVAINPATGTRTTLLGSTAADSFPAVSPSGQRVAFTNGNDIWVADFPSGNNRTQVTTSGTAAAPFALAEWNPTSTTLVFQSLPSTGLFTAPAVSGAAVTAVTGALAGDGFPDFSPDGQFIVFSTATTPAIARLNANGTGGRTGLAGTTGDGTADQFPRVSPNGSSVVFSCADPTSTGISSGICTVPFPNGGSRVTLAGSAANDVGPTYSPDGTKVVFTRLDLVAGTTLIGTVNANGTGGFAVLVGSAAGDILSTWAPAVAGGGPPPVGTNPAPVFTAGSSCGGSAMLRLISLFGPATAGVSASDTAGQTVTLTSTGAPGYVDFVTASGNPAIGTLAVSLNPLQWLNLLFAVLLQTPSTVTITATDNGTPVASSTCDLTVRVGVI